MARAARLLPAKQQELSVITGDYERLRYGSDEDEKRLMRYIRAVRRFKVNG
jgi:hypothetical protein